jgi:hypothetical protein
MLRNKFEVGASIPSVPEDSINTIGSVISNSARQNVYTSGEWTSSGPWTNYFHSWQDANSITQGFNMFMGDGYPEGTSQPMYVNDGPSNAMSRVKEFAHGDRLGNMQKSYYYYDNATGNYAGVVWRCTPVRNTTNKAITRSLYAFLSEYDGTYGGSSIAVYTPNASTYAATTDGSWSTPWSGGSTNPASNRVGSIVIPANTTVLVFTNSCIRYATSYRYKDSNMLYNLGVFFDGDLLCDLRMLETLATARLTNTARTTALPHKLYTACAAQQGDR